jgi:hypothetical protein
MIVTIILEHISDYEDVRQPFRRADKQMDVESSRELPRMAATARKRRKGGFQTLPESRMDNRRSKSNGQVVSA